MSSLYVLKLADVSGGKFATNAWTAESFRGLCFCRTCQESFSGGAGNLYMAVDAQDVPVHPRRRPSVLQQEGLSLVPNAALLRKLRRPSYRTNQSARPTAVLVKVGSLDDPSVFQGPSPCDLDSPRCRRFICCLPMCRQYAEIPRPPAPPKNA